MVASSYEEDIQFGKILKKYNSRKRKYKPSMIQETSSEEDEEEAACRRYGNNAVVFPISCVLLHIENVYVF